MDGPLRSLLAVVVGYLAMGLFTSLLIIASAALLDGPPTQAFALSNLAISVFGAVLGGFVAGRLAPSRPLAHGIGLGALAFAVGAGYQVVRLVAKLDAAGGPEPAWYLLALPVIALVGCSLGGVLEQRRRAGDAR